MNNNENEKVRGFIRNAEKNLKLLNHDRAEILLATKKNVFSEIMTHNILYCETKGMKKITIKTCKSLLRTELENEDLVIKNIYLKYRDSRKSINDVFAEQLKLYVYKKISDSLNISNKKDVFVYKGKKNVKPYLLLDDVPGIKEYILNFGFKSKISLHEIMTAIAKKEDYIELSYYIDMLNEFKTGIPEDFSKLYPDARAMNRHFVIHVGGTNTGKTYDAMSELMQSQNGIYLAPLRLLAMENQELMNNKGVLCSLSTGEEEDIVPEANHISCTVEKADCVRRFETAVIDECQLIADDCRGWAWTNALLGIKAEKIHVCTAENGLDIIIKLIKQCKDTYEIVQHKRTTKLFIEKEQFVFDKKHIHQYDALIVFSRQKVLQTAELLESMGVHASVIYGALPFKARKEEVRKYVSGETSVVVATDAIGMGMNLPIRRIVFLETEKYDGKNVRFLTSQEVKQIAGRAGRRGMFPEGYVNSLYNKLEIEELLNCGDEVIKEAIIQMPETLLEMDMPVSGLIKQWNKVGKKVNYQLANTDHDLSLSLLIEKQFKDFTKKDVYKFIHIPFDETNEVLLDDFMSLLFEYNLGYFEFNLIQEITFMQLNAVPLEKLELMYKQLDLLYSFLKIIKQREMEPLNNIDSLRERICNIIIKKLLQKQNNLSKKYAIAG